jgi:light-regulated signal transduction histidine kinase (bacteriophytochrome)
MWFRPEVVRTVKWAGDMMAGKVEQDQRLHPRQSFATWSEQVRWRSEPWRMAEIDTVTDFRNAVVNFVLRRAEERAALSDELERSNKELEAFSYSVSHDLRAPFRHIVGFAQLLAERETSLDATSKHYMTAIIDSALSAGRLVDDLLAFSQLGRAAMAATRVDMSKLAAEVQRGAEIDFVGRNVEWRIGSLPPAWGDAALLRQALVNLVGNALKYTRGRDPAVISVGGEEHSSETVYFISDNGVGFDMAYVSKIFGVFQRLHRSEEFEGTGIGLALTKRVIDRHSGWIRAEAQPGIGARFEFGLPKRGKVRKIG